MRLLVYDTQGKMFVKARHFQKAVSFTSKNTGLSGTAKFSVVAQRTEQVRAYDCYKLRIIREKFKSYSLTKHNL